MHAPDHIKHSIGGWGWGWGSGFFRWAASHPSNRLIIYCSEGKDFMGCGRCSQSGLRGMNSATEHKLSQQCRDQTTHPRDI